MNKKDNERGTDYIAYEYQELTVPKELGSLCRDSYPCFGWEEDKHQESSDNSSGSKNQKTVTLYFRRNRAIPNKAELTRLQRNFDSCIKELTELERSKTTAASIIAMCVGVLGTAFMACSTFAVTADPPITWLMILLAVPGILGWIVPYFLYRAFVRKKTAEVKPLIEKKYDEIYRVCERGNSLLY